MKRGSVEVDFRFSDESKKEIENTINSLREMESILDRLLEKLKLIEDNKSN